jgi:transcriptional regulator with XRE-family HTH domain
VAKEEGSDVMRMWGGLQRRFRIAAGVSHEELAQFVGYSKSLVVGIERGLRMPSATFVAKADECLGANGWLVELAQHLSRQRNASWTEEYAEAEKRARILWAYDTHVLHGLLQTEAYARAVLSARCPALTEAEIDAGVQERLRRQELLTRTPPCAFSFVIEECVLQRSTGGEAVMTEQLEHLLQLTQLRNVTVQVMPMAYGSHAGVDGPLTVLELPDHQWLGYLEIPDSGQLVDDADQISRYHERFSMIRGQALTPADSAVLIARLHRGLPAYPPVPRQFGPAHANSPTADRDT